MGVGKGFWDVLRPVVRMESLESVRGKVLAIDLSFWMIQLLTRVKGIPLRKPHIRLLFFRTIHLIAKIGAFPVFVADGEPPPLKLQVRLNRFCRISGVPLNTFLGDSNCNMARNNLFTENVDECVKLLELLGLPVLRAKHEAEALCAELQRQGLVNACLTPDSDAFLYGAQHVIKILQGDSKDPHVESYMMRDIESFLGLHREHLVALALLAGCDYNVTGVPGIGCQNAVRLLKAVPKHQIFDRLRDWGAGRFESEPESGALLGDSMDIDGCGKQGGTLKLGESIGGKEPHCSSCGHPGTKKLHSKLGCEECRSNEESADDIDQQGCTPKVQGFKCTCEYCTRKETMKKHMKQQGWKIKVCQKIFETRGFPNEEIIGIFMDPEHDTLSGDAQPSLAWKSPRLEALEEFLEDHLHWDKAYVRRKLLPLLSFYCLKDTAAIRSLDTSTSIAPSINGIYVPHSIQRIKISFSKPLFRLRWSRSTLAKTQEDWLGLKCLPPSQDKKIDDDFDMIVSDLQTESLDDNLLFTTDEDMMLVKEAYPDLVSQFEKEQDAHKSKKKGKKIDLSRKQLRITSFFQSRKGGACSHDAKGIPDSAVQGSTLGPKTQVVLTKDLDTGKEAEPQTVEAAVAMAEKQARSACEMTGATQVGIICKDDVIRDTSEEDVLEYPIASIDIGLKADGKSLIKEAETTEIGNKQVLREVILIEDEETVDVYPCKANRLGNNSPGSRTSRERFSSLSKMTTTHDEALEVIDVDTPPTLPCWRDLHEGNKTKASALSQMRSSKASARRVLFS